MIEFGAGLGFAGLAMMGLQFLLTARYRKMVYLFGMDELLQIHGHAGYFACWFLHIRSLAAAYMDWFFCDCHGFARLQPGLETMADE